MTTKHHIYSVKIELTDTRRFEKLVDTGELNIKSHEAALEEINAVIPELFTAVNATNMLRVMIDKVGDINHASYKGLPVQVLQNRS